MRIGTSGMVLWGLYGVFVVFALYSYRQDITFQFGGPLGGFKALVWLSYFAFLAYSVYCSFRENFFRSVKQITALHWGRQISADLYLGLLFALFIIFLNEGAAVMLVWIVPTLIYANLAILLYLAINFESIVTTFLGL